MFPPILVTAHCYSERRGVGQPEFRDCDDSHQHMAVFKVTKQQRLIQNAEQLGRLKQEFNEYRCT